MLKNYFLSNRLFTPFQSVFFLMIYVLPIYLLSVIHEIQTASDENPTATVKGFFSDISKAFDKIWYEGIIFILKVLKMSNFFYSKTLLKIEKKKSCFKCSNISVEKNNVWRSTRISARVMFVFNIHKLSSVWNKFIL